MEEVAVKELRLIFHDLDLQELIGVRYTGQ